MSVLRILNNHGDTPVTWTTDKPAELANARATFQHLIRDSAAIYQRTGSDPATDVRVREFDPKADELIAVRQMVGG